MSTEKTLVNRVQKSGLITLDLGNFYPKEPIEIFDIKDYLVKGLVLMEKPFREALKEADWEKYKGKIVGVHCSTDALIPMWAYMLITSYLEPHAQNVYFGDKEEVGWTVVKEAIAKIDTEKYQDARVVIKGCGDKPLPPAVFVEVTKKLQPVTKSLMYGEPCSTVPVYKKPKGS